MGLDEPNRGYEEEDKNDLGIFSARMRSDWKEGNGFLSDLLNGKLERNDKTAVEYKNTQNGQRGGGGTRF